jgi:V8-like Glu-specific endopeptidase
VTEYDDRGWWGDVLHGRDGALADGRDGHRVGAHAVARDAAGGVGGRSTMIRLLLHVILFSALGLSGCGAATPQPPTTDPFITVITRMRHAVAPTVCFKAQLSASRQAEFIGATGTAFFVSKEGHFLTAAHVLDEMVPEKCPAAALYVAVGEWPDTQTIGIQWFSFPLQACVTDQTIDVALCRTSRDLSQTPGARVTVVTLDGERKRDGTSVAFSGFPLDFITPLTSRGAIAGYRASAGTEADEVIIDKATWPGASGSPVYGADGRVVGMLLKAGIGLRSGLAYARAASVLQQFLSRHGVPSQK